MVTGIVQSAWLILLVSLSLKSLFHAVGGYGSSNKTKIAPQEKKKDAKRQERAQLSRCVHKLVEVAREAVSEDYMQNLE